MGAATAVASAVPPWINAIALGTKLSGAIRIMTAVDIDQLPPIAIPKMARPTISVE
ncbi:hypothetical protein D3C71_2226370 [compost metagenome]